MKFWVAARPRLPKRGESMEEKKTAPRERGAEEKTERQNSLIMSLVWNVAISVIATLLTLKAAGVI